MASVIHDPNGLKRVQFTGIDEKRRVIRLGKKSDKIADAVARHIENILSAALHPPLAKETAQWLADQPDRFYAKLVTAGLVNPREGTSSKPVLLGAFLDQYVARRIDIRPATKLVIGHVVRNLKDNFGQHRPLNAITPAECDDFRRWLETTEKLAPATIGKRIQWCAGIFRDAVRRKLIVENPFSGVKRAKATNPERQRYIDRKTIEVIIDAAPSAEWRLLIGLSRYLGLRVPSEPFSLTWDDVDWEKSRMRITCVKTSRYDGRAYRWVPILPEVRPYLDEVYAAAPEGAVYVLDRLRQRGSMKTGYWGSVNLRTQFEKIIRRAGFEPWVKLWHNLRASAQTDLAGRFPLHVACTWLGNSKAIAAEHYLQVTDEHFRAALEPSEKAAQKAAHSPPELTRIETHGMPEHQKPPCFQGDRVKTMAVVGLEPTTHGL